MASDEPSSFADFSHLLDARILRSLADMGFAKPTLIQEKAIPLALENRDILARAKTGSGKTVAYLVPVLQKILNAKDGTPSTRALVLVPTRELAAQVHGTIRALAAYCPDVSITNLSSTSGLSSTPSILISTPARLLQTLPSLPQLESLVIDEADLILSYGHAADIRHIFSGAYLPRVYQTYLMSATMSEDVELLKGLTLRNPVTLKLEEDEDENSNLTQYAVRCSETDKFLLIYVILKLKLIRGKCIMFVNDVDRCYRLKLFLEQFSIKSCVLNSELPLNSRYHAVQEFNKGVYDYIIATDESGALENDDESDDENEPKEDAVISTQREQESDDEDEEEAVDDTKAGSKKRKRPSTPPPRQKKKARKGTKKDAEYGVTRGIDFIDVACVLNFDLPTSSRAYTHRVGRTARAGRTGMSLSFAVPREQWGKDKAVGRLPSARRDEKVFARIELDQGPGRIKEYKFDMKQVEGFRYRMQDALRSVTRVAIRDARIRELKQELLGSEKLKAHFEDNPDDLEALSLKHDRFVGRSKGSEMKHVPAYLMPKIVPVEGQATASEEGNVGFVPFRNPKTTRGRGRGGGRGGRGGGRGGRGSKKKSNPLRNFK
ncbi:DEAD-domain-containing protein [Cylindrobasidium torrendii FP15055 ss-10]|uniref:RNA helicase n=1 Tax=Cylindrobasidium torrendii FP15055 ss-10 TaxID=1314674 RepID=A0A0D7B8T5_9AGAR|nr:DEAD-domain-containing protein [Cylindrobasidium torrendii FP15055 ss-10]